MTTSINFLLQDIANLYISKENSHKTAWYFFYARKRFSFGRMLITFEDDIYYLGLEDDNLGTVRTVWHTTKVLTCSMSDLPPEILPKVWYCLTYVQSAAYFLNFSLTNYLTSRTVWSLHDLLLDLSLTFSLTKCIFYHLNFYPCNCSPSF